MCSVHNISYILALRKLCKKNVYQTETKTKSKEWKVRSWQAGYLLTIKIQLQHSFREENDIEMKGICLFKAKVIVPGTKSRQVDLYQ